MSAIKPNIEWGFHDGDLFRRDESFSKMMAISLIMHLVLFSFLFLGRSSPRLVSFQSYQVDLISPDSDGRSGLASGVLAPVSSPQGASDQAEAPKVSSSGGVPSRKNEDVPIGIKVSSSKTVVSSPPKATPSRPPIKEDPERLHDWWSKQAKSIKIPRVDKSVPMSPQERVKGGTTKQQIMDQNRSKSKESALSKKGPALPGNVESGHPSVSGEVDEGVPGRSGPASGDPLRQGGGFSGIVGAGPGLGSGSGLFEKSHFMFPWYLERIENKISGNWSPPRVVSKEERIGAIVRFNVNKSGVIESIEIEKSSGNTFFDQAAMRAIFAANPLPPLPDGLTQDQLKVHFSFIIQKGS